MINITGVGHIRSISFAYDVKKVLLSRGNLKSEFCVRLYQYLNTDLDLN